MEYSNFRYMFDYEKGHKGKIYAQVDVCKGLFYRTRTIDIYKETPDSCWQLLETGRILTDRYSTCPVNLLELAYIARQELNELLGTK